MKTLGFRGMEKSRRGLKIRRHLSGHGRSTVHSQRRPPGDGTLPYWTKKSRLAAAASYPSDRKWGETPSWTLPLEQYRRRHLNLILVSRIKRCLPVKSPQVQKTLKTFAQGMTGRSKQSTRRLLTSLGTNCKLRMARECSMRANVRQKAPISGAASHSMGVPR